MIITFPTKLFFGKGDILLSHINTKDHKYHGLGFAQVEPGELGRKEERYKNSNIPRQAEILFSNVESLNILIKSLESVRKNFKEKENE